MLEIKDLRVRFHDADHNAVDGISLTVDDSDKKVSVTRETWSS